MQPGFLQAARFAPLVVVKVSLGCCLPLQGLRAVLQLVAEWYRVVHLLLERLGVVLEGYEQAGGFDVETVCFAKGSSCCRP